jgi:hypothetical protein
MLLASNLGAGNRVGCKSLPVKSDEFIVRKQKGKTMTATTGTTPKPATSPRRRRNAKVNPDQANTESPSADIATMPNQAVAGDDVIEPAAILPSMAEYAESRNAYEGAGVASAEMLEKIVNARAYSTYVTRPDGKPALAPDLFADYLGDTLTLPGKSEARNRIVMALVDQKWSQPKVAEMLNVTRPAIQYIVNKANGTLPPSQNGTPAVESGEEGGNAGKPEKTPEEKINAAVSALLKVARDLSDDDRTELVSRVRSATKTILAMSDDQADDNADDDSE